MCTPTVTWNVTTAALDSSYDIAIVGAGLAGAFSAFHLSRRARVIVLERDSAAAGASGAGAGVLNPFMARKANPVWRWKEALRAVEKTLSEAGCPEVFRRQGVLRPASQPDQASWFAETARAHPSECEWLPPEQVSARWPAVAAPLGALLVKSGGSIDLPTIVDELLDGAQKRGCEVHTETAVTGVTEEATGVVVETDFGDFQARRVLLCAGADHPDWPLLSSLPLHDLKGQTIVVERPAGLGSGLPCLSGSGYIVPYPDQLVLGSTYHHEFEHRDPTAADTREILSKTAKMIPALADARVVSTAAGVRVTVPKTRLPIVGPLTGSGRIWAFTGLGSKGLLMGALIGSRMPAYFDDPESIPVDLLSRNTGPAGGSI